ncbi:type I toxin-antitoxin system Fst family toxin [Lactobacillus sp. PV034]|nr:type I toxin-antitoxin system Fst family toxin [Lactobacillus sp. PV034]QNQ80217.1 type I toxin-antitoxin system Fst family toxin [Lactobacillus sp. PV034]
MKWFITFIVAPLIVEIATKLFDYWLSNRHNK